MNTDLGELMRLMRRELWIKRRLFAGVYIGTAILFLVVGWHWPKLYTSSSTIVVDQQSILEPLMQGTAVTTNAMDKAGVAREIIFSRRAMQEVLENGGWLDGEETDLERERLAAAIEYRTRIENVGDNVIRISYMDQNAERAHQTAQQLTEVFINHSLVDKQRESRDAYEFINGQVLQYQAKLKEAEEALKQFRSRNMDAQPGSQDEVTSRIADLKGRKETTELAIRELETERETLARQLSGRASLSAEVDRSGQQAERLEQLEQELATLRLSYHDTYPDIVVLKGQIETIRQAMARQQEQTGGDEGSPFRISGASGDLFSDLRSRYAATETELATLQQRLEETDRLLNRAEQRLVRVNAVEAQLSELMRDYQVNQDIYQSLQRQRENARISMNIDMENQGLTFQVQEPPALPLTPKGIRFSHFMAAGLVASLVLPFGLIYGLTMLDQKVRSRAVIGDSLGLPVLASVYHTNRPTEYTLSTFKKSIIFVAILVSWIAYGYVAWLKANG
ncbi:XrtA system polysaccharide chain length determinant [Gilvimarinus sp. F26214L]|uniref:XrtA system polysaccharide chain length determinant n=1 Tax=Gilvimarinus sp. DZF01 TaxID=3461371 RepID=UPI004045E8B4